MYTTVNCVPHEWCLTWDDEGPKLTFFDGSVDAKVVVDLRNLQSLAEALERHTIRKIGRVE